MAPPLAGKELRIQQFVLANPAGMGEMRDGRVAMLVIVATVSPSNPILP